MWMALSKIAVCFITVYGQGLYAAKPPDGERLRCGICRPDFAHIFYTSVFIDFYL